MSCKIFKNRRAARRHLSNIDLNILAVDKCLKPSYLWDTFHANSNEIQNYLDHLIENGKIEKQLNVITVNDDIFITYLRNLEIHLQLVLESQNDVFVVDVSKKHTVPVTLSPSKKHKVLRMVVDEFYRHLSRGCLAIPNHVTDFKLKGCNLTTLFGVLLGYPVLYWYDCHWTNANEDLTCLSMLPLKVHKLFASVEACHNHPHNKLSTRHELYSFSIPNMLMDESAGLIDSWLHDMLTCKSKNSIFKDLQLVCDVVTLPYVVL